MTQEGMVKAALDNAAATRAALARLEEKAKELREESRKADAYAAALAKAYSRIYEAAKGPESLPMATVVA